MYSQPLSRSESPSRRHTPLRRKFQCSKHIQGIHKKNALQSHHRDPSINHPYRSFFHFRRSPRHFLFQTNTYLKLLVVAGPKTPFKVHWLHWKVSTHLSSPIGIRRKTVLSPHPSRRTDFNQWTFSMNTWISCESRHSHDPWKWSGQPLKAYDFNNT